MFSLIRGTAESGTLSDFEYVRAGIASYKSERDRRRRGKIRRSDGATMCGVAMLRRDGPISPITRRRYGSLSGVESRTRSASGDRALTPALAGACSGRVKGVLCEDGAVELVKSADLAGERWSPMAPKLQVVLLPLDGEDS